jgi:hypothetical protein
MLDHVQDLLRAIAREAQPILASANRILAGRRAVSVISMRPFFLCDLRGFARTFALDTASLPRQSRRHRHP